MGEQSENKLEETGDEGVVDRNNTYNSYEMKRRITREVEDT